MNIEAALYSKLAADTTLVAMLATPPTGYSTSIYSDPAPQGADPAYIVYSLNAGTDSYTFSSRAWENDVWLVKAVTQGSSGASAGTIADRIDTVLNDSTLTISGHTCLSVRRESPVRYVETDGADRYNHRGGLYRIYAS